jgi:hypothetical protein
MSALMVIGTWRLGERKELNKEVRQLLVHPT